MKSFCLFFSVVVCTITSLAQPNPADKFVGTYEVISYKNSLKIRYIRDSQTVSNRIEESIKNGNQECVESKDGGQFIVAACKVLGKSIEISTNFNLQTYTCDPFDFPKLNDNFKIAACFKDFHHEFIASEDRYSIGNKFGINRSFHLQFNSDGNLHASSFLSSTDNVLGTESSEILVLRKK